MIYNESKEHIIIKEEIHSIESEKLERTAKKNMSSFIEALEKSEKLLQEFDESIWNAAVEMVKMNDKKSITFVFKDGSEIKHNF